MFKDKNSLTKTRQIKVEYIVYLSDMISKMLGSFSSTAYMLVEGSEGIFTRDGYKLVDHLWKSRIVGYSNESMNEKHGHELKVKNYILKLVYECAKSTNDIYGDMTTTAAYMFLNLALIVVGFENDVIKAETFVSGLKNDIKHYEDTIKKFEPSGKNIYSTISKIGKSAIGSENMAAWSNYKLGDLIDTIVSQDNLDSTPVEISNERCLGYTSLVHQKVYKLDSGMGTPVLSKAAPGRFVRVNNPLVYILNHKLKPSDIFNEICAAGLANEIVIFCPAVSEECVSLLISNVFQGVTKQIYFVICSSIKNLSDIAFLTGADICSTPNQKYQPGKAKSIYSDMSETTIEYLFEEIKNKIRSEGDYIELLSSMKVKQNRTEIVTNKTDALIMLASKISGCTIKIKLGGDSEMVREEVYEKLEDAVKAMRFFRKGCVKSSQNLFDPLGEFYKIKQKIINLANNNPKTVADNVYDSCEITLGVMKIVVAHIELFNRTRIFV